LSQYDFLYFKWLGRGYLSPTLTDITDTKQLIGMVNPPWQVHLHHCAICCIAGSFSLARTIHEIDGISLDLWFHSKFFLLQISISIRRKKKIHC